MHQHHALEEQQPIVYVIENIEMSREHRRSAIAP